MTAELTHFDPQGRARMVDVSGKDSTQRVAVARGSIVMEPETLRRITGGEIGKGDVLALRWNDAPARSALAWW